MTQHPFEESLAFAGSGDQYRLQVDDRWEAQPGNIFGGFVLAVVVRAAGMVSTAWRPLSMACQFVRPARVGVPIEATVVSLRRGRTNELLSVTLKQADKTIAEAYVRAVDGGPGPVFEPQRRPRSSDPLSLPLSTEADRALGVEPAKFLHQIESRDSRGATDDRDLVAWWRLGPGITYDDPWLEGARLAITMDAAGAAVVRRFLAEGHPRNLFPWGFSNLDGLGHFHELAGTEWLCIETQILTGAGGYASAQTQTWSADSKRLLASAITQLGFFDRLSKT
jgi:hypothetical protein